MKVELIHGDCIVEMKNIPDKSIDMILCDLTYEVLEQQVLLLSKLIEILLVLNWMIDISMLRKNEFQNIKI